MLSIFRGNIQIKAWLCSLFLLSSSVAAVDWSGYGSVRLGQFSIDGQPSQIPEFYRETDKLSVREETLFGLQMQHDIADDKQLVVQWQARGNREFEPETKLLFLRWQLDESWQLKVGRLAVPLFAQSDTQYIGYSHDYSRLPKAVYWRFDYETAEGISLEHQQNWSWATLNTQLLWGNFDGLMYKSLGRGVPAQLTDMRLVRWNLEKDDIHVVAGFLRTGLSFTELEKRIANTLLPAFQQLGTTPAQQQQFLADIGVSSQGSYWYYGLRYQPGDWKFEFERSFSGPDKFFDGATSAWFAAISHSFDDLVVSFHHEKIHKFTPDPADFLSPTTPANLYPLIGSLRQSLNQRMPQLNVLSMRYDLSPGLAIKADYFRGHVVFVYDQSRKSAAGFSLGVDFVF